MGFSKLIERTGGLKRFAAYSFTHIYGVGRKRLQDESLFGGLSIQHHPKVFA